MTEENNKDVVIAEDITDIALTNSGYYWDSGYNEFDFTCRIRGEADQLHMTEYRHDDGSGITVHSDKNDIWDRMPRREIYKLDDKLQEAIQYGEYHKKIEKAKTKDDCDDVRFELMEDNNVHLNHVIKKLWSELSAKEEQIEKFERPSMKENLENKKKQVKSKTQGDKKKEKSKER